MGSVTTWRRLEPRPRSTTLTALAARVADPLWMLERQARTGELTGSDRGSLTRVRLAVEQAPITRWAPGTGPPAGEGAPLLPGEPIERLVDAVPPAADLTARAAAGRYFLRLLGPVLAARYGPGWREHFALPPLDVAARADSDGAGLRWSRLLAGRAIDGEALRQAFTAGLPDEPPIDPDDTVAVQDASEVFVRWWDERFRTPAGAWTAGRLAAPFQLAARTRSDPTGLVAPEHRGGRVDWHTFDGLDETTMAATDPEPTVERVEALATALTFPGMPRPRWWEFEDAAIDLGRLDAAPDDLARLLLAEFALVYGNDFFLIPMTATAGTLVRISGFEVDTCFGETIPVPSAAEADGPVTDGYRAWRMFDSGAAGLVLAPSTVDVVQDEPREEVLLTRDEMADLAWAIELRVTGPTGAVVERREVEYARQPTPQPAVENPLRYRLATTVPQSWLPLLPTAGGTLDLSPQARPAGRLIGDTPKFSLEAIELPRTGRRVTLMPRRARAADGTVLTWLAWQATSSRGESLSGLRYDELTHER